MLSGVEATTIARLLSAMIKGVDSLGSVLMRRSTIPQLLSRIALAGMRTSAMIELFQGVAIVGRTASTDDVVLNTIGVTLGAPLTQHLWRSSEIRVPKPRFEEAATVPVPPITIPKCARDVARHHCFHMVEESRQRRVRWKALLPCF